jgi:hypothetical protein
VCGGVSSLCGLPVQMGQKEGACGREQQGREEGVCVIESVMAGVNEAGCVGGWIGGMKWEMMAVLWRMCDVQN